jgi:hypothetical protein
MGRTGERSNDNRMMDFYQRYVLYNEILQVQCMYGMQIFKFDSEARDTMIMIPI